LCWCSSRRKKTANLKEENCSETHILQELNVTVAVATEFEALDIAMRYQNEVERPHQQLAVLLDAQCLVCSIFLCLKLKEDYKTFGVLVIPHLSENCVALFNCCFVRLLQNLSLVL